MDDITPSSAMLQSTELVLQTTPTMLRDLTSVAPEIALPSATPVSAAHVVTSGTFIT